jgi:multisubunit Na+/H+ antiporter MnhC subunit
MFTLEESAHLGFMLRCLRALIVTALVIGFAWAAIHARREHRDGSTAAVSSDR